MHFDGTCFFPGKFDPPNKFHYNAAKYLESRDYITNVCIILGNEGEYIDNIQKKELWETYIKSNFSHKIVVESHPDKSSLKSIHEKLNENASMKCYIALDEDTAKSEVMKNYFSDFPNYLPEILPSQFEPESENMIKSVLDDNREAFYEMLPEGLSDENKEKCWHLLRSSGTLDENMISGKWWMGIFKEIF